MLILLLAMIVVQLVGMGFLHHSESYRLDLTVREQERTENQLLGAIIDLSGRITRTTAYDYTYWDEMVDFVHQPDSVWAAENINSMLSSFHITAAWVFDANLVLVYRATNSPDVTDLPPPISLASRAVVFRRGYFPHFFIRTPLGILEVDGAPIQPTADTDRRTEPQGFLFVGQLWTPEYLGELSRLVDGQVTLALDSSDALLWTSDRGAGMIRTADTLFDADNKPLAIVRCQSESPFLMELNRAVFVRSAVILIFLALLVLVLWVTLHRFVTRPLMLISGALANDDPRPIEKLKRNGSEFGQIAHLIGHFFKQNAALINEIVRQKHTEEALIAANSKVSELAEEQRILLENARDFIYRHNTNGVFHFVSQSVEAVTGFAPHEWMRHYTTFLTDNPVNAKVIMYTEKTIAEGTTFPPYLVEIYHKQGHRVMLEISEQPFFKDGKIAGIVGVARDVTLRIQTEEQRQALQERLKKAEQMESLGLLAGGVAHDLNNILGPLVAYPELIMMKLPPDSPHRRQLAIMGKAAQDAADVIQDLLALARRGRCELKPLNVNNVLRQYQESPNFLSLRAAYPRVAIVTDLDDSTGHISGSSSHLMKAVMNIVVNAFEAMPNGGTLTIKTTEEHLDHLHSDFNEIVRGDYVVLSIKDTGVGIDQHDIQRIFQPYYSNKQMGASGSGLGLAVVYGIVKDHNGYYDVISELGKGTEFLLYFPVSREMAERDIIIEGIGEGTGTILVVDDVPEQREIAEQILTDLGYEVSTAVSGRAALAYVAEHSVDLVVLDMILEKDFDGLDTYREILKISPGQKALIVSGFAATNRVSEMQALGAGSYLKKPYTRQQLAHAVKQQMQTLRRTPTEAVIGFS